MSRPERLGYAIALVFGASMSVLGGTLPALGRELDLSISGVGLIVTSPWSLLVPASLAAPALMRRWGATRAVAAALMVGGVALGSTTRWTEPLPLAVTLAVFGFCAMVAHVGGVAVVTSQVARRGEVLLMRHGLFFGVGSLLTPLFGGALLQARLPWRLAFLVVMVANVLLATLTLGRTRGDETPTERVPRGLLRTLRLAAVRRSAVGLLLYVGLESAIAGWLVYFLTDVGHPPLHAAAVLAAYWVGMLLGRVGLARMGAGLRAERLMVWPAYLGAACLAGAFARPLDVLATAALVLVAGVAVAGVFPGLLALGTRGQADTAGASGLLLASGSVGAAAVPSGVGVLSETFGLSLTMTAVALLPAVVGLLFHRRERGGRPPAPQRR